MKDISLNRMGLLFKRYFSENWKRDVIIAAIIFGVEMFTSYDCESSSISTAVLFVFFIIYSGSMFGMLSTSQRSINYLMIPASTSEKVIVNICLSQFYYPLLLVAASCLGILASTLTCSVLFSCNLTLKHISMPLSMIDGSDSYALAVTFCIVLFMFFNSIMMFGSVYFRRKAIIKTLLFVAAFFGTLMILFGIIFNIMAGESYNIITNAAIADNVGIISMVFMAIAMIFFWFLTFFRLRETEA